MGSMGGNVLSNNELKKQIALRQQLTLVEREQFAVRQQHLDSLSQVSSYAPSPSVRANGDQQSVTPVAITVNILGGGTTTATAREMARQVVTEINELNRRKRAA